MGTLHMIIDVRSGAKVSTIREGLKGSGGGIANDSAGVHLAKTMRVGSIRPRGVWSMLCCSIAGNCA